MKKIFLIVLTVVWMSIIFILSNSPGEESKADSYGLGMLFCDIFVPDFEELPLDEQIELALKIDHPIRKGAHFFEYFVLGVLMARVFEICTKYKYSMKIVFSWIISSLYAISDEVHQVFVPGRHGKIGDILLDSIGALVGVLIVFLFSLLYCMIREKITEGSNKT